MAMASIPPGSRDLKSLPDILTREYGDVILGTHYEAGPPAFVGIRCEGDVCPPAISEEIGRSGFGLQTYDGENSETCEIIVTEVED